MDLERVQSLAGRPPLAKPITCSLLTAAIGRSYISAGDARVYRSPRSANTSAKLSRQSRDAPSRASVALKSRTL
jgi:hypothetical protein